MLSSGDVNDRPTLAVGLRFAQHVVGKRCDIALTEQQIADQVSHRVTFGPTDLGVGDFSRAFADKQ